MELNLTANTPAEEKILQYLKENASETLAEKINNGTPFEKDGNPLLNKKTLSGFMKYACDEARNLAEKGANSACIDDVTVYGWAIHFFQEDSIEGTLYTIDGEEYKPVTKTKKLKNQLIRQLLLQNRKINRLLYSILFRKKTTLPIQQNWNSL